MKKIVLILFFCLGLTAKMWAQSAQSMARMYPKSGVVRKAIEVENNRYMMVGGGVQQQAFVQKTDSNGLFSWLKYYGTAASEFFDCKYTVDGSYIFVGSDSTTQAYITKTDTSGNILWQKHLNYGTNSRFNVVYELPSGNIVAAGSKIVLFDSVGNALNVLNYNVNDMIVTPQGDYVFVDSTSTKKIDATTGNVLWTVAKKGRLVEQDSSGNVYVVDSAVVSLSAAGAVRWQQAVNPSIYRPVITGIAVNAADELCTVGYENSYIWQNFLEGSQFFDKINKTTGANFFGGYVNVYGRNACIAKARTGNKMVLVNDAKFIGLDNGGTIASSNTYLQMMVTTHPDNNFNNIHKIYSTVTATATKCAGGYLVAEAPGLPAAPKYYDWTCSYSTYSVFGSCANTGTYYTPCYLDALGNNISEYARVYVTKGGNTAYEGTGGMGKYCCQNGGFGPRITGDYCLGGTLQFDSQCSDSYSFSSLGSVGFTYQWYLNGVPIANSNSASHVTSVLGVYSCSIMCGASTIRSATTNPNYPISAPPAPDSLRTAGSSRLLCGGAQTVKLVAPPGAMRYEWYKDGTYINTPNNTADSLKVLSSGSYTVKYFSGTCGVYALNSVAIYEVGGTVSNNSVIACASAGANIAVQPIVGCSYLWNTGATTNAIVAPTSGTYTCTVMGQGSSSCQYSVVVLDALATPKPTINTPNGTFVCNGGSVNLVPPAQTGMGYLWNTGATTRVISPSTPGVYKVKHVYPNGCISRYSDSVVVQSATKPIINVPNSVCAGVALVANVSPGFSGYNWMFNNQIITTTNGTATFTIPYSGWIKARATTGGCLFFSDSVYVTLHPAPSFTLPTRVGLCGNPTVTLRPTNPQASYNWLWNTGVTTDSLVVSQGGNYSLTATDANGCQTYKPVQVADGRIVNTISISGNNPACNANPVILKTNCADCLSYTWLNNGTAVGSTPQINATTSGIYTLQIINTFGCASTTNAIYFNRTTSPMPTIQELPTYLESSYATGNQWQKPNPSNIYVDIPGATASTFVPVSTNTNYRVRVLDPDISICWLYSAPHYLTTLAAQDLEKLGIKAFISDNFLYINLDDATIIGDNAVLIDAQGKKVSEYTLKNTQNTFDITTLPAGVYVLHYQNATRQQAHQKIVKIN